MHSMSSKEPTLPSCNFDKHGLILIILSKQHQHTLSTSSPAVAERTRDALCFSVVSFNSTMRRAQSSVISYFGLRFTAAYK